MASSGLAALPVMNSIRCWGGFAVGPVQRMRKLGLSSDPAIETPISPPRGSALEYFEEAIEGQSPSAAARGWYQQLDKGIQCAAEDEACDLADDLRPALHELTALASAPDGERFLRAALRWVLVRDDLECFAFLLGRKRRGTKIQDSLERLDREAANHLSIFSGLDLCKDPRLRTVSWQEPDQWWGRLALPK